MLLVTYIQKVTQVAKASGKAMLEPLEQLSFWLLYVCYIETTEVLSLMLSSITRGLYTLGTLRANGKSQSWFTLLAWTVSTISPLTT